MHCPRGIGFSSSPPRAQLSVTLIDGIDRVLFHTHVEWDEYNHRLRVAMPVPRKGRHVYGIPYGVLERRPYTPSFHWSAANGDWPAINWAGVEARGFSVALLNKGLPSYRMEPGATRGDVILLSILRSPAVPTYLHEPQYYTMVGFDGMRDAGAHDFEYALAAYPERFRESPVVREAEAYNAGLIGAAGVASLPEMPKVRSRNVRLTSVKWAEKGRTLILRLCEYRGTKGKAVVTLPEIFKKAEKVNLLERQAKRLPTDGGKAELSLRAWEIATLRLGL
jgi:alpha-mannosidase